MIAIYLVHWPGKDVLICNKHFQKIKGLAAHMGWPISAEPYLGEDIECGNCENEKKSATT